MAFHLTNRGIISADTRRARKERRERERKKKNHCFINCLALTPGHVFLPHTLALSVCRKLRILPRTGEKACSLCPHFWGQTQTHPACLSCSIIHSLQGLIQHVQYPRGLGTVSAATAVFHCPPPLSPSRC